MSQVLLNAINNLTTRFNTLIANSKGIVQLPSATNPILGADSVAIYKSDEAGTQKTPVSDLPISDDVQAALNLKEDIANKGAANGYPSLGSDAKVPDTQLPSNLTALPAKVTALEQNQVDGWIRSNTLAELNALPTKSESTRYVVDSDATATNNGTYKWSGSAFVNIAETYASVLDGTNITQAPQVKTVFNGIKYKSNLEAGKNKFNKNDPSIITPGYFSNVSGNIATTPSTTFITHYIPIKAGQTLYAINMWGGSGVHHELTDVNRLNPTFVAAIPAKTVTATIDGFVRISLETTTKSLINTQIELGTSATTFEPYKLTVLETEIPSTITRNTNLLDYSKLEVGKNKFNKNDPNIITPGYFDNSSGRIETSLPNNSITGYIPIKAGQTLYSPVMWNGSGVRHELTDVNKQNPVYVLAVANRTVTATVDGFARISITVTTPSYGTVQIEEGTVATSYVPYLYGVDEKLIPPTIQRTEEVIVYTFDSDPLNSTVNFNGATAVADALNFITDASKSKKYKLIGKGNFKATNYLTDFPMTDYIGEFCLINGKDYVDIEGISLGSLIFEVELPDNLGTGFAYNNYQVAAWNVNATLKNAMVIAKNCRYAMHIESPSSSKNIELTFDNCLFWHKGNFNNALTVWSSSNAIGSGLQSGQKFNINNCTIRSDYQTGIACHSPLNNVVADFSVNLNKCNFIGANPHNFSTYITDKKINVNISDCIYNGNTFLSNTTKYFNSAKTADYSGVNIRLNNPVLYKGDGTRGKGLRITSKSTGTLSSVKFDETYSAFNLIIGDSKQLNEIENNYFFTQKFGYMWKLGQVGSKGVAIGLIDIDSSNTSKTNGLGTLLGDCSTVNKTLRVIIDGSGFNILFNENFTAQTNAYVIAKIVAVIGAVADVDEFVVESLYYPDTTYSEILKNTDITEIKAGMGVVKNGINSMRRATNIDTYIDGICLYDTPINSLSKVLTKGSILYAMNSGFQFSTLENVNIQRNIGIELGIGTTPGVFEPSATVKAIRAIGTNIFNII